MKFLKVADLFALDDHQPDSLCWFAVDEELVLFLSAVETSLGFSLVDLCSTGPTCGSGDLIHWVAVGKVRYEGSYFSPLLSALPRPLTVAMW